ncbi:unnamed protein product, partial [Rotaria sp. Silwood2]
MQHNTTMQILMAICIIQVVTATTIILPKRDTLHKSSGLIMKYLSEYKPANDVTSISIAIPMVSDMCYIIPLKAMKKIPQCNIKTKQEKNERGTKTNVIQQQERKKDTIQPRNKRFIMDIISIAIGTASTALSAGNIIQMNNLQKE